MDTPLPFLVLDHNCLRHNKLLLPAISRCRNEGLGLLVPEGAFFEFSKGSRPFDTWRQSLRILAEHRHIVSVSRKLADMRHEEVRSGRPCLSVHSENLTLFLRSLLKDIASNDFSTLCALINGPVATLMPDSLREFDDAMIQNTIRALHDELRSTMPRSVLKELRHSTNAAKHWLFSGDGIKYVFQSLKQYGVSDSAAIRLLSQPSITAAFTSAILSIAIDWLAQGGINSSKPTTVGNDIHDIEYTVLGAVSAGLVSLDKRVRRICDALRDASRARSAWIETAIHDSSIDASQWT